jgi:hypothetical protein
MNTWTTVIDFAPIAEADTQWRTWLARNGLADLASTDVRIDTGRGQVQGGTSEVRRYSVRTARLPSSYSENGNTLSRESPNTSLERTREG